MIFSSFDILFQNKEAERLVSLLKIMSGFKIAEIGAGKGLLSLYLARVVGQDGLVFSTEFDEAKLNKLRTKITRQKVTNLQISQAGADNPNLPDVLFDVILMSKVYHHFTNSAAQNKSFYAHLKSEGQLVVVDFEPKWYLKLSTPKGIPANYGGHGIYKNVLISEVEKAGFKLKQLNDNFSGGGMFCAIFNKL
ncbi:MAG: class I SAM-dependent methyltransferase [Candidatus Doudnabacteria bacterium]|jgi:ubiquinone/menaquinone biosynthesis C-methylase UbiE